MKKIISLLTLIAFMSFINLAHSANKETVISKIEVIQDTPNFLKVSIDYIYTGSLGPWVNMVISPTNGTEVESRFNTIEVVSAGKGKKTVTLSKLPAIKHEPFVTNLIQVSLVQKSHLNPFYSKTIDYFKNWQLEQIPNTVSVKERHSSLLSDAIKLIDDANLGGKRLQLAKKNLERIILNDPKNVQAYLELARVRMKEDTEIKGHKNSNGVTQAGKLINIALEIDDTYANSYILLGYVKTLENKLTEAIQLFEKAHKLGTKNMWLYSNWGRALEKADESNKAIKVYKQAITLPLKEYQRLASLRSSNRAIPLIFTQLISLLSQSKNWKEVDKIYQKKLQVFNDPCSYSSYASFRLKQFGDFDKAITLTEKNFIKKGCKQFARRILASAYLLKIANSKGLNNEENTVLYNKSIVLMANPVDMITDLAGSEHTLPAIEILSKKGTGINSKDTRNYTPLAYAIYRGDESSANALINKGVNLSILVSERNLTYLMLAVAYNRENLVKLLIKKGVDTTIISEEGHTASSIATELRLNKIEKLLSTPKGV